MSHINRTIKPFELNAFRYGAEDFYTVSEKDVIGKWSVFFFYPADFTFVCPTELEDLASNYDHFLKLGVEIYSVSTDSHWTHKAWHEKSEAVGTVRFPMLSDAQLKLSKQFEN